MEANKFYREWLTRSGSVGSKSTHSFSPAGKVYLAPKGVAYGYCWVYEEKDSLDIKIHDFHFFEDRLISLTTPEYLGIIYYDSVSGEGLNPYHRLTAECAKTFHGGHEVYRSMMHKDIPIHSVGIKVFPAYYEKYLQGGCPNDYIPPREALSRAGQTLDFPEMSQLSRQIWEYRGEGIPAKLFYEAKIAEAVSLVYERGKNSKNDSCGRVSKQDMDALSNAASYINDHFNSEFPLEMLTQIACMDTTELKTFFKQTYRCTIFEYIQQRRMRHAEMLLVSTDLIIEQVILAVRYSNAGRFAANFKTNAGLLPSEYHKMAHRKYDGSLGRRGGRLFVTEKKCSRITVPMTLRGVW